MSGRRWTGAALVLGLVGAVVSLTPGGSSAGPTDGPFLGTTALSVAPLSTVSPPDRSPNPRVVEGADGWLYIAQDWTVPCQDQGQAARVGRNARALAEALEASGREAVVTVGPDKATVVARALPVPVPDAVCAAPSKAAVWDALVAGPAFLDLRSALADAERRQQTYWRKDTHWTPTGGAVYARALAERLDPSLARRLRTEPVTWTRDGDLARVLGRDDAESVPGRRLVNPGVRVEELPAQDIGMGQPARRTRAVASGDGRVLPGLTVFVGDSFDAVAVEQLAPLFEETLFFWPGGRDSSLPTIMAQVARGDRVVVETVERFASRFRLFDDAAVQAARQLPARVRPAE